MLFASDCAILFCEDLIMNTKIIWHFDSDKKERGTTFATKEEYTLAIQFEDKALVDQDLKTQVKKFIKTRYKVSVHQLTYRERPMYTVSKLFGGAKGLCEELNISTEELCELSNSFHTPHKKSRLIVDYLLPVLKDQDFANWFYSTVYNLYNNTTEPLLLVPSSLPQEFYEWLSKESRYTKLIPFLTGKSIPSGVMIGDYIYEHRGSYSQLYDAYSFLLSEYITQESGKAPQYLNNIQQRTTIALKKYGVLVSHKLESMGINYKSYMGMFHTTSPKLTHYITTIANEVGFDPYDMLYTIILNSVEYYAKKPSHKRNVTLEYFKEQQITLKRL